MSRTVLVTGAANGVGKAVVQNWLYQQDASSIVSVDKEAHIFSFEKRVFERTCDVTDPEAVALLAQELAELHVFPDTIIQCAGVNCIASIENLSPELWADTMNANARALWLMVQQFLPALRKYTRPLVLNVISNASHMPMTDSCAYNASKGAAHIMTLQMARELTRKYGIAVIGVSPNKLSGTRMSGYIDQQVCESRGWTMEQAQDYQRQSLLWREETPHTALAEFIVDILQKPETARWLSGCVLPFGA